VDVFRPVLGVQVKLGATPVEIRLEAKAFGAKPQTNLAKTGPAPTFKRYQARGCTVLCGVASLIPLFQLFLQNTTISMLLLVHRALKCTFIEGTVCKTQCNLKVLVPE
jgi:hypothetical protein